MACITVNYISDNNMFYFNLCNGLRGYCLDLDFRGRDRPRSGNLDRYESGVAM